MLDESIRMIQDAEREAEARKISCRAALQRMLTEAQAQSAQCTAQAEDTLREEREALLAQAEQEAAVLRLHILEAALRECNLLQAQAQQNQDAALDHILTKGV